MTDDTPPQSQWPKSYLLQVMEAAVAQGCIRLPFLKTYGAAHADRMAKSFIGALNRIRRRSDKQHRSFIIPEYHLISTTWERERGTLLVTYSSLPDDMQLPQIEAVSEDERRATTVPKPILDAVPAPESAPTPTSGRPPRPAAPELFDPAKLIDDLLAAEGIKPRAD